MKTLIFSILSTILSSSALGYTTQKYSNRVGYQKVLCKNGEVYIIFDDKKFHEKARRYCNEVNVELEKMRELSSEKKDGAP